MMRWVQVAPFLQGFSVIDRAHLVKVNGLQRYLIGIVHRALNHPEEHLDFGFGFFKKNFAADFPSDCADVFDRIKEELIPLARRLNVTDTEFACLKALALLDLTCKIFYCVFECTFHQFGLSEKQFRFEKVPDLKSFGADLFFS